MITMKMTGMLVLLMGCLRSFTQEIKTIRLKNEPVSVVISNYHIITVKDERRSTHTIGSVKTSAPDKRTTILDLENGAARALTQFIRVNIGQDSNTTPMELRITRFAVKESDSTGPRDLNELSMVLSLFNNGEKLVEYAGGGFIESTGDATRPMEQLIRTTFETLLKRFDNWWAANKEFYTDQKTKTSIRVEVTVDSDYVDSNYISYSPGRPLGFDDFRGKADEKIQAAALTYSLISVKYSSIITVRNEIIVDVSVSATFNKNKSWFRSGSRNIETLAHEQRHFDISAIKACELVDTLRHFTFSVSNYPAEIGRMQRQKLKELDELQNQFDLESAHGSAGAVAEKWDGRIRELFRERNCY